MDKTVTVTTKVKESQDYKGEEEIVTLTIDLTNLTEADMEDLAIDSLVIKWATKVRKLGQTAIRALKGKDTYIAQKAGTRSYTRPMTKEELLAKVLSDPTLLAQIMAAGASMPKIEG
jgi:hypothetical protein